MELLSMVSDGARNSPLPTRIILIYIFQEGSGYATPVHSRYRDEKIGGIWRPPADLFPTYELGRCRAGSADTLSENRGL